MLRDKDRDRETEIERDDHRRAHIHQSTVP